MIKVIIEIIQIEIINQIKKIIIKIANTQLLRIELVIIYIIIVVKVIIKKRE
jgi:hypothetical protein